MIMLFLYAALVLSVAILVGVAVATVLRIRKKINALPVDEAPRPSVEIARE
jgi:hypothetical protein